MAQSGMLSQPRGKWRKSLRVLAVDPTLAAEGKLWEVALLAVEPTLLVAVLRKGVALAE